MPNVSAESPEGAGTPSKIFFIGAIAMAAVTVAGFAMQFLAGRSSFGAPLQVHAHAVVFMGWLAIYVTQSILAVRGSRVWHRRLGWIAMVWLLLMLLLGARVLFDMMRRGQTPFIFRPLQLLAWDSVSLLAFAGLTIWAVAARRNTDWHARLHFCAMVALTGPGINRLIPAGDFVPWALEVTIAVSLIFPAVAILVDRRSLGRVHPAWLAGLASLAMMVIAIEVVTYGPLGQAYYRAVTADSPGSARAPLEFPARPGPPPGPPPM